MTNPHETVTARIIESLKAGVIPWAKPWKGTGSNDPFPRNFRTGTPYRGANILILWSSAYTSQYWLTFKEELVAEVGSSFLCAIAGITNERTEQNATAYIQHWIEALQGDSRLVITAASAAQKAIDAIVGYAFEDEGEELTEGESGEASPPVPLPLAA